MKQDTPHPHPSLFETAIADLTDAEKQKVQILFDALRDELADKIYETLRDDDTTEPIGVETHKDAIIRHQILASFIIPLPLITEILAQNATEVVTDGTKTYYLFGEHYAVRVIGESMCFCFICRNGNQIADRPFGDIFDVHTLQHLLRLPFVGLSDVANNLII